VKVTVVVPVYNKERYIQRCIRSVLAQTLTDFELILVNDGSTDRSVELAEQCTDTRIRVVHQQNGGPGSARNTGIALARSEVCAFLDADDEWLPGYLHESLTLLDEQPSVSAVVSGYIEYPRGICTQEYWRRRGISDGVVRLGPGERATRLLSLLAYMSCWSTVVRRDVLVRWGGFYDRDRCRYAEDSFLWLKVLLNEPVRLSTAPRVKFHREASDLSGSTDGPRPIEPFLRSPELVREACPPALAPILEDFLAIRAYKTSCMLGFWGEWRLARELFSRFARINHLHLPYFFPALLLSNRLGGYTARFARWGKCSRFSSRLESLFRDRRLNS
jgi:glycosyltransferase involved in cell wall biosynthesis